MDKNSNSKIRKSLDERLREHPELRSRVEQLLNVVENVNGDVVQASEAEELVVEELRRIGQEALQEWAIRQSKEQEQYWDEREGVSRKDKKNFGGILGLERSK